MTSLRRGTASPVVSRCIEERVLTPAGSGQPRWRLFLRPPTLALLSSIHALVLVPGLCAQVTARLEGCRGPAGRNAGLGDNLRMSHVTGCLCQACLCPDVDEDVPCLSYQCPETAGAACPPDMMHPLVHPSLVVISSCPALSWAQESLSSLCLGPERSLMADSLPQLWPEGISLLLVAFQAAR